MALANTLFALSHSTPSGLSLSIMYFRCASRTSTRTSTISCRTTARDRTAISRTVLRSRSAPHRDNKSPHHYNRQIWLRSNTWTSIGPSPTVLICPPCTEPNHLSPHVNRRYTSDSCDQCRAEILLNRIDCDGLVRPNQHNSSICSSRNAWCSGENLISRHSCELLRGRYPIEVRVKCISTFDYASSAWMEDNRIISTLYAHKNSVELVSRYFTVFLMDCTYTQNKFRMSSLNIFSITSTIN